eukprot:scaffold5214_cov51-Attheya_sp.AAC.1
MSVSPDWYTDDAGARGKFESIKKQFVRLQELVNREVAKEVAKAALRDFGFRITISSNHYLGGYIGEAAPQEEWVHKQTSARAVAAVKSFAKVCKHYPQLAYAGLQESRDNKSDGAREREDSVLVG